MTRAARARGIATSLMLALPALAGSAAAQQADTLAPRGDSLAAAPRKRSGGGDLRLAAGLAATAVAIAPFDVPITRRLRAPDVQRSAAWRHGAVVFDWYGAPGALIAGPVIAVAGSAFRSAAVTDIGIHIGESYVAAALTTFLIKGIAGRARPYTVTEEAAYNFRLGRGFPHREPYSSFPSGHATGSFAFASSITAETAHRWPQHARLVGTLAYGGAILDGVSRVYRDTHWPSDVAVGALVGTMSGVLVTRHQHAHPNNRLDALARFLLIAPAEDAGLRVGLTRSF